MIKFRPDVCPCAVYAAEHFVIFSFKTIFFRIYEKKLPTTTINFHLLCHITNHGNTILENKNLNLKRFRKTFPSMICGTYFGAIARSTEQPELRRSQLQVMATFSSIDLTLLQTAVIIVSWCHTIPREKNARHSR